jgi:hypothetical protein
VEESHQKLVGIVAEKLRNNTMGLLEAISLQEGLPRPTPLMSHLMQQRNHAIMEMLKLPAKPGQQEADIQKLHRFFLLQVEATARASGSNATLVQSVGPQGAASQKGDFAETGKDPLPFTDDRGLDLLLVISLVTLGTLVIVLFVSLLACVFCKGSTHTNLLTCRIKGQKCFTKSAKMHFPCPRSTMI